MYLKKLLNSNKFVKSVFIVSLFVIFLISAIAYKHVSNVTDSTNWVVHTLKVKLEFEHLISNIKDVETEHRGFIITGNKVFENNFQESKSKVIENFKSLLKITIDNSKQQARILSLQKMVYSRFKSLEKIFEKKIDIVDHKFDVNYWYTNDKNTISVIQLKVKQMIEVEETLLRERQHQSSENIAFTPLFLYVILLLTIGLTILSYIKTTKDYEEIEAANKQLKIFEATAKQSEILGDFSSFTWNLSNNKLTYSDNLYRILGVEPQSFEATNEVFLTFVHPEDIEIVQEIMVRIVEDEELNFAFFRIIDRSGNIKNIKTYGKVFVAENGEKTIIGITHDATDEVQNLLVLTDRNKLLERSNQELSAFNYIASHDLQEPLRKIQTFISRFRDLKNDSISADGLLYLEKIENSATRMRVLIDDLLQFSRMNKSEKVHEKINLNDVVEFAKHELSQRIEDEHVKIVAQKLPFITGIRFQIDQLFLNLIINAIKYKKPNIAPEITIKYSIVMANDDSRIAQTLHNRFYKITIADNGMGFEAQYNEKIFTLFNRLHNKTDYPGTGIGLSICRKVIENHNGYIFASGQMRVGAVFTMYLPVL